ncbi:MAG: class I SAM-dependent methyltransferase [Ruthenibacterium lactatiformans]
MRGNIPSQATMRCCLLSRPCEQPSRRRCVGLGFGTGMLTARLYAAGHPVAGVDFPRICWAPPAPRCPAQNCICMISHGPAPALEGRTFDFIISTYAFHHVPDAGKPAFLLELSRRLSPGGECLIGDVAFETQAELDACHAAAGTAWDCGEDYAVAQLLAGALPSLRLSFARLSHCAGVLAIGRHDSPQPV